MAFVSVQDEFQELERRALAILAQPKGIEPRAPLWGYRAEIRLWDYPSLQWNRSWTVFLPLPTEAADALAFGGAPVVREAKWDRRRDAWRLSDPVEQIQFRSAADLSVSAADGTIPAADLRRRLAALERLGLPLLPANPAGGPYAEFFGLDGGISFKGAGVQWWCGQSLEWQELADWFGEMRRFLVGCIDPI